MIELDRSQQEFCRSESDDIRLLAPAGCGKTSSLLYRCRALADRSDTRQRFLLLSFTNAAAAEARERLSDDPAFADIHSAVRTATLNSWGWQRLQQHHSSAKLLADQKSKYFAVRNQLNAFINGGRYDDLRGALRRTRKARQPHQLMEIIDELKSLRFDHTRHIDFKNFRRHVKSLKNLGLGSLLNKQFDILADKGVVERTEEDEKRNWRQFHDRFFAFWKEAVTRLHEELTYTFEDQKYWNYLDMVDAKPVPAPTRYHHILVDEFQDINPLDLALIDKIAKANRATLTIVGDDDQAIFEWRGASPKFILEPELHFGREFKTYTLQVNYRSPRNVVYHSQKLISHNANRVPKKVKACRQAPPNAKIEIVQSHDIAHELDFVTQIVLDTQPGRVAVVAKSRAQLIPYEIHFASNKVGFETATDLDLFQSDTLKDISDTLLVRDNKKRMGDSIRSNVGKAISLCDLICKFPLNNSERKALENFLGNQAPRTAEAAVQAIQEYPQNIKRYHSATDVHYQAIQFLDSDTTADALRCLARFEGTKFNPLKASDGIFFTAPPLEQLATLVEKRSWSASDLEEMIIKAKSRIDEFNRRTGDSKKEAQSNDVNQRPLHLMTAPRSKGKEFETVVILSVLDGVWPHKKALTTAQIEAERRLFYVAFTRAKRQIVMLNGPKDVGLSPFVRELELPDATGK